MLYTFKSVKNRYIFSGLVICLVSLVLVSVSSYFLSLRITTEQAESRVRESALRNASELDAWFGRFSNLLDDTVEDIQINNRYDRDYLLTVMETKLIRYSGDVFDFYIGMENPDQTLISGSGWIPDSTYDPRKRPWYIKARQTGSTIFTKPYIDAQTGRMVITLARRIFKDGRLLGVMAADIFISDVLDQVRRYSLSEHSYAFLLDDSANFVSHPKAAFQPHAESLTNVRDLENSDYPRLFEALSQDWMPIQKGTDFTGEPAYFMLSRIPSNHWIFGISIPVSDYREPLDLLLKGFLAAAVVSLLISTIIMLRLVNGLAHPIRALTKTIRSFSGTALDVRAEVSSRDEIGELGKIFNNMADTIQEYSRSLEHKVAERTRELEQKNSHIQESIDYAKTIQETILPSRGELETVLKDHFVIWEPRDTVGGDFYWLRTFKDGFVALVGDCTGHGVPGALMTMAAGTLLDRIVTKEFHDDPALILAELNRLLDQILRQGGGKHIEDGLDAGIIFIPAQGGTARFAGAGISLLVADGGNFQEIRGDRHGIGYASFNRGMTFALRELEIHSGMNFYLSTDGIRDQIGGTTGLPFGRTRLNELLSSLQGLSMEEQRNRIINIVREYRGKQSIRDDQTLFAITT